MNTRTLSYTLAGLALVAIACLAWKKKNSARKRAGDEDLFYLRPNPHRNYYGEYTL